MKNIIITSVIILAFCFTGKVFGQQDEPEYLQLMRNPGPETTFSDIQQAAEEYFADHETGEEEAGEMDFDSDYARWKRWEYLNQSRLTPEGKITNISAKNWAAWQEYKDSNPQWNPNNGDNLETTYGYWDFLAATSYTSGNGWNPGIGRVNCIAFHPSNSSIIYIGMPSGGLWKTTNGGTNWTCLTDGMPSIGVSGIAINPSNANIIYILTGDGDGGDTQSIGVLKTTNGGVTWSATGLSFGITSFIRGYKLLMHPSNYNTLFAATNNGIYKTTNGGTNWTNVVSGTFYDIEFNPGNSTIMYGARSSQFYRSTNTGDTWTQVTSGVPTTAYRMAIGVTPNNSSYVYLFCGPSYTAGTFVGLYRSFDNGLSFGLKSTTPNILGYSSTGGDDADQTTYDLALAVSRTDVADMMTGGIGCWTSTDFGATWTISSYWSVPNAIGYTHADIHALEINPLNNYIYCGSDGGIFRSTDFGNTWTDLSSGIGNTQWYRIAGTESNVNLIIGGTQDNGSNKWSGGTSFQHILGADGMDCMIDFTNSNILYATTQGGALNKSTNGGTSFSGISPSGASGAWVTPFVMSPASSTTIYGGYSDVYKSTNGGSSWTSTGVDGRGAMAVCPSNSSRVYASYSSTLYRSDNAAGSWSTMTSPGYSITGIAVDASNSLDVFVCVGNYYSGTKVFESTNGGSSWVNISGTLPNIPANCIAYEPGSADGLYLGTDIGVFYRDDNTGDWIPFMNGLPTVPVFDLEINSTNGVIRAGTFGRGLWSSALYTPCPAGYVLTPANDPSNPNFTGFQDYEASSTVTSSRVITGGIGTDVTYKAGGSVTLLTGFHVLAGNKFKAVLGQCSGLKSPQEGESKDQAENSESSKEQ